MQAYKCDICGSFFTEQKDFKLSRGTFARFFPPKAYDEYLPYDVCPNCVDTIQAVIDKLQKKPGGKPQ